jgi:hypothetical protein
VKARLQRAYFLVRGRVTRSANERWQSAKTTGVVASAHGSDCGYALLLVSGGATWYSRTLPCPTEPVAARSCKKLRRINVALYLVAEISFALGITFAYILPRLT